MIPTVATTAAVEQLAQERRRRQLQDQLLEQELEQAQRQRTSVFLSDENEAAAEEPSSHGRPKHTHGCDTSLPGRTSDETGWASPGIKDAITAEMPDVANRSRPTPATTIFRAQAPSSPAGPPLPPPASSKFSPLGSTLIALGTASLDPVARLVDAVLQLTNERFGASLRVQRKLAEEVVQGVEEAADESEVLESSAQSRRATQLITQELLTALDPSLAYGVGTSAFAEAVEDVYKFDLLEDNPNWSAFLMSSSGSKVQAWESRRSSASSRWDRLMNSALRKCIYMTLSYPDYSKLSSWVGISLIAIIILNAATFCIESVPHYAGTPFLGYLTIVDCVCLGIFTVEYVMRLLCCPHLGRFMRSFSNFIDLVAILPFYVELCVKGSPNEAFQTRVVRLLRVFRVLRIVKSMPKLRHLTLVSDTLKDSFDVLAMLACLLLVLLVVFGTIIFFVEPSTFDSIPQAMYYVQTTLTTTGYGDLFPITPWGRFVAGIMTLLCMVVVSLPIAVIGGKFSDRWSDYKQFRDAVDRSSRVHPTTQALRKALERYEQVLDDVMKRLHECEVASEKQVQTLREQLTAAREVLERDGDFSTSTAPAQTTSPTAAVATATGCGGSPDHASSNRFYTAARLMIRRVRAAKSLTSGGASVSHPVAVLPSYCSAVSFADVALDGGGSTVAVNDAQGSAPSSGPRASLRQYTARLRTAAALALQSYPMSEAQAGGRAMATSGGMAALDLSQGHSASVKTRVSMVLGDDLFAATTSEPEGGRLCAPAATAGMAECFALTSAGGAAGCGGGGLVVVNGECAALLQAPAEDPAPAPLAAAASGSSGNSSGSTQAPLLPPPPFPPLPAPPPAPPPPPPQPEDSLPQPSPECSPTTTLNTPIPSSISLSAFARHVTKSFTVIIGGRRSVATSAIITAVVAPAATTSATSAPPVTEDEQLTTVASVTPPLPQMTADTLQVAVDLLNNAAGSCNRARDLRMVHDALAAQARLLQTDDAPSKLEKLDEHYRRIRCWQDELGPMAERIWCLRDALDELAWALQRDIPEQECKYHPTCREARVLADGLRGALRRRTSGAASWLNNGSAGGVSFSAAGACNGAVSVAAVAGHSREGVPNLSP